MNDGEGCNLSPEHPSARTGPPRIAHRAFPVQSMPIGGSLDRLENLPVLPWLRHPIDPQCGALCNGREPVSRVQAAFSRYRPLPCGNPRQCVRRLAAEPRRTTATGGTSREHTLRGARVLPPVSPCSGPKGAGSPGIPLDALGSQGGGNHPFPRELLTARRCSGIIEARRGPGCLSRSNESSGAVECPLSALPQARADNKPAYLVAEVDR